VYRLATAHQSLQDQRRENHHTVAMICKGAVRKLATLSKRDRDRVFAKLCGEGVLMMDLQLELCMQQDSLITASFLIIHMSAINHITEPGNAESSNQVATLTRLERRERSRHSFLELKDDLSPSKNIVRTLKDHLLLDDKLSSRALEYLANQLKTTANAKSPWGLVSLLLRAYAWLLYRISDKDLVASEHFLDFCDSFESVTVSISSIAIRIPPKPEKGSCIEGKFLIEEAYGGMVVALLLTFLMTFSMSEGDDVRLDNQQKVATIRGKVEESIRFVLETSFFSRMTEDFASHARFALWDANFVSLEYIFCKGLFPHGNRSIISSIEGNECLSLAKKLSNAVLWVSSNDLLLDVNTNHLPGPSVLITRILQQETEAKKCEESLIALKLVLATRSPDINDFVEDPACASLFMLASRTLYRNEGNTPPIVSIKQIDTNSALVQIPAGGSLQVEQVCLLAKIMYCFLVKENSPASPFNFDPRLLPLKEVYAILEKFGDKSLPKALFCNKLRRLIDKNCPEVKIRSRSCLSGNNTIHSRRYQSIFLQMLRRALSKPAVDPAGVCVEMAHSFAKSCLSDAELAITAMSGFMSLPASPAVFFTYPMLYRDPLTTMKCPISIWSRPGLRVVILNILAQVLEANDFYVEQTASNEDSLYEYLESRNLILIRCFTRLFAGQRDGEDVSLTNPSVAGVLRTLISRNKGISASLVRIGLYANELDWLIEVAPEMIQDVSILSELLSEKSSLSPSEKLVASDSIIRIIVLHGYQDDTSIVAAIQIAFSHILNGFFLVVGQPAIPLSFVDSKGTNVDFVKTSRNASFRILKILQRVRLYRTDIRNECIFFLQKFIGLCKGESLIGTLPSASTNRQKGLLKELLDAAFKAAESIGFAIQAT
jgi:hypothetical protein